MDATICIQQAVTDTEFDIDCKREDCTGLVVPGMAHDMSSDGVAEEFTSDSESDGIGDGCVLNSSVEDVDTSLNDTSFNMFYFTKGHFDTKGHLIEHVEVDRHSPTESADSEVSSSSVGSEYNSSDDTNGVCSWVMS